MDGTHLQNLQHFDVSIITITKHHQRHSHCPSFLTPGNQRFKATYTRGVCQQGKRRGMPDIEKNGVSTGNSISRYP